MKTDTDEKRSCPKCPKIEITRKEIVSPQISSLTVDSSRLVTDLCILGSQCGTDKSPFFYSDIWHRHPYTAIYDQLFQPMKDLPIHFAEIGVAIGASHKMWHKYFSKATIYAFDYDVKTLNTVRDLNRVRCDIMDVRDGNSMEGVIQRQRVKYDVLIDDSSHHFDDQIRIIDKFLPHIKAGGLLIIEDLFRKTPESDYIKHLKIWIQKGLIGTAQIITTEHFNRWSPGWDNDKLLIITKK